MLGSTVVFPYENDTLPELELGASIFVKANKNLWRASDEFNLTRHAFGGEDGEMGIWDGEKLLFTVRWIVCLFWHPNNTFLSLRSSTAAGGTQQGSCGVMDISRPSERMTCELRHKNSEFRRSEPAVQHAKYDQKVPRFVYARGA